MLSYWPHQALTSMTAGWSRIATAAVTPHTGRSRSAYSDEQRETDVGERRRHLHERPDPRIRASVTVWKAGWIAASTPQM